MHKDQYSVVASRRQGYDTLLWQVPAIGLAAQSFLVSTALSAGTARGLALLLWGLAFIVGLAVLHLFVRLRYREVSDSELLKDYEASQQKAGFVVTHGRAAPSLSAYRVWFAVLGVFLALALGGIVTSVYSLISN